LLVISDGAPGLISACELVLARSLRQRCLIHRSRNILAKVPASAQAEVKKAYWDLFADKKAEPGQAAVEEVRGRIASFAKKYGTLYPAAVRCLTTDTESLTVYLRFPKEHWKRIRHSNFIERSFGEARRRVKVIGRLPDSGLWLARVGLLRRWRKLRCLLKPASLLLSAERPSIAQVPACPPRCCTQLTITVPPQVNDKTRQRHDYPSPEHRKSYARRTAAERAYASLADPSVGGIRRGWSRMFGLAKNAIAYALGAVARNLRILDSFEAHKSRADAPKRQRRRRHQSVPPTGRGQAVEERARTV
jgi:hypothetical protein